jgi:hypothetical protein
MHPYKPDAPAKGTSFHLRWRVRLVTGAALAAQQSVGIRSGMVAQVRVAVKTRTVELLALLYAICSSRQVSS